MYRIPIYQVKLVRDDGKASIELDWKERELDPALEPGVFAEPPPEGAEVVVIRP